jgi:hypothetical protein
MGILSRLFRPADPAEGMDMERIDALVERVANLHPQLRLARRYQARLAPAIATSLKYIGVLVDSVPSARETSAAVWSSDPFIHAYFGAADDVAEVLSRSSELRAFFDKNPDAQEVYAVLGMNMAERHFLGVSLEGEVMRRDVPQTSVNFSDHQVRMCGCSDAGLRAEIVQRLLDQLALEGLARVSADKRRRDNLEQERALLKTRVRLLERQGTGIRMVFGGEIAVAGTDERARVEAEIAENEQNLKNLGLAENKLDRELDRVRDVFAEPQRHIYLSTKRLRLDRMNIIAEGKRIDDGEELEFHIARIPGKPSRSRAFSLVRFARADLLPASSMLEEAERLLASGTF